MKCDTPLKGGCQEEARELILARAGENVVGNGMAVWSAYWRCGNAHRADDDARSIRRADPEALVMVFVSGAPLEPGAYSASRYQ